MTQGYIFLGIDDINSSKNISCAYALSLSLKLVDPNRETCVIVHKFNDVPKRYEHAFDYIVELPFGRTEINHHDMYIDFWQVYHCTPFDETMFIDTYSLVVDNVESLWYVSGLTDLAFASALDFRGNIARNKEQFEVQDRNQIPIFDSSVCYFTKSMESSEFFKIADPIFKNWHDIYTNVLSEFKANDFDFTLLVNIVSKLNGNQFLELKYFDYIDLTINILWTPKSKEDTDWFDTLNIWITDSLDLKVNNHRQTGIVRYGDANYMTKEMIQKFNDHYSKSTKQIKI